jgi:hypothetical protein
LKKNMGVKAILLLFGLVIALGACAKPPTAEMEAAEAAVTRAENDPDAAAYADSALARARNALTRAQTEVKAKRYDSAKTYAAEAVSTAEKAVSDGRAAAARAKEEAGALLTQVKELLTDTENALENAKTVPLVQLDFPALTGDLDGARNNISQADAANNTNRPREALDKGRAARSALGDIQNKIGDGVRAVSRKK